MPQINNSEIPVNPSFVHNREDERREEDFSTPDSELIEINPFVHLQRLSSELQNVVSVVKQSIDPGRVKELLKDVFEEISKPIKDIKESINLNEMKKELLNNVNLKGYKQWKV